MLYSHGLLEESKAMISTKLVTIVELDNTLYQE